MNLEKSRYLNWLENEDSVIVSMALSCPAKCKFCYIDSILEEKEEVVLDASELGGLLATEIINDNRFIRGIKGTNILMGGFSDPFFKENIAISKSFIKTLISSSVDNIVHVATRFCANDKSLIHTLSEYNNLIINYSITSMDGLLTMGSNYIQERFNEAKILSDIGILGALYIRPVIPGVTIRDVPEIIKHARRSNIKHVTVGRLFFDKRILNSLVSSGVTFDNDDIRLSKFVLDNEGVLSELNCQEMDIIKVMFKESGFKVFSSSREISHYLKR